MEDCRVCSDDCLTIQPDDVLLKATRRGHVECVKKLIQMGANVNTVSEGIDNAETPLTQALRFGKLECVSELLLQGADVNKANGMGFTPLVVALVHQRIRIGPLFEEQSKRIDCIRNLLKFRAEVNVIQDGVTPLMRAMLFDAEVVDLLLAAGADVNFYDAYCGLGEHEHRGETPLICACYRFDRYGPKCVKKLLGLGADVNAASTGTDITAIFLAASCGSLEVFELLVKFGATVKYQSRNKNSVLLAAAGNPQGIGNGSHILSFHVCSSRQTIVRNALKYGAHINMKNEKGLTALDLFVLHGRRNKGGVCNLLCAAGETPESDKCPDRFKPDKNSLKGLCREAIRQQLLKVDRHSHLFGRVPLLGLPSSIQRYLLYDVDLD